MASIQVQNVVLQHNPARYTDDFNFHIRFEAIEDTSDDLNWKLVYVGSSESEKYDQILEDVVVGPIYRGPNEFVLNAPCPDHTKIPPGDILGVTVILLICEYQVCLSPFWDLSKPRIPTTARLLSSSRRKQHRGFFFV